MLPKVQQGRELRCCLLLFTRGASVALRLGMLIDASFNHITGAVIQSAVAVHKAFGPGLLESCYRECLQHDLGERGLRLKLEQAVPIVYGRLRIPAAYRIDPIVEDLIVVEVNAVERMVPIHAAQVLTYVRLTNSAAGLLINFNVPKLMAASRRRYPRQVFTMIRPEARSLRPGAPLFIALIALPR